MQSSFVLDIVVLVHRIAFDISYSIAIFDIRRRYSWDLSYIRTMPTVWYSLLSFTLIRTWHFLYIGNWLSFSWPAHFDWAYRWSPQHWCPRSEMKRLQERFSSTDFEICLWILVIAFDYSRTIPSSSKSGWSVWPWRLPSLILVIIFDFSSSSSWNVWLVVSITCGQWDFVITFEHVLITKFRLVTSDHATQHSCGIGRKLEKCGVYAYNCRKLRNWTRKSQWST